MKQILSLLVILLVVFGCSKNNIDTETETTSDLTQMIPNKSLEKSTKGMYFGVFGNNEIRDLHGKIIINAGNDGNYNAIIIMLNGQEIKFKGKSINKSKTHFTSERGSFDFNAPIVTNVFIDNEPESYMVVNKSNKQAGPLFYFGSYDETGNESGFWGNCDMIGMEFDTGLFPEYSEFVFQVVISHKGDSSPFINDIEMEISPPGGCLPFTPPVLVRDVPDEEIVNTHTVFAEGQTSFFAGHTSTWRITRDLFGHYDESCNFIGDAGGTWSWNSKTGKIY